MNQEVPVSFEARTGDSSPLLAFREVVELSVSELFGFTEGSASKVSREVYSLLTYCADLRRQDILSVEKVRRIVEDVTANSVMHVHLQELTADVLFQFSSLGTRHSPYDYKEAVTNFVNVLIPEVKNDSSLLNRDNQLSLNFYQDRGTVSAMLDANPWLMVIVVLCYDSKRYAGYEVGNVTPQA